MLTYHQATVALAGLSLTILPETVVPLDACEQRLGLRLPAAAREWYALDPPPALMGLGDNQDWPYGMADLGKVEGGYGPFPAYNPLDDGYLVIMRENQSVVLWAIWLNGSDDPPVMVRDARPNGGWHHHADRFSEWLYTRVWDYQTMFREDGCRVEGGRARVTEAALTWLRQHYQEEPRTLYWPADATLRFSSPDMGVRILIGNITRHGAPDHSYNYFWANDARRLEASLRDVQRFDGMTEDLWSNDEDGCGAEILAKLRQ